MRIAAALPGLRTDRTAASTQKKIAINCVTALKSLDLAAELNVPDPNESMSNMLRAFQMPRVFHQTIDVTDDTAIAELELEEEQYHNQSNGSPILVSKHPESFTAQTKISPGSC